MINFSSASLKGKLGGLNLYLVGMMGSGKSMTGPILAKELLYGFVDMDTVIEKLAGKSIVKIFEEESESNFRDMEYQVLKSIGERHSLIVSTGGGVVLRRENWGILRQGVVIWIDPGREVLIERLTLDQGERPLLKNGDPRSVIDELLVERRDFYSEADMHLIVKDESPEEVSNLILQNLPSIIKAPN